MKKIFNVISFLLFVGLFSACGNKNDVTLDDLMKNDWILKSDSENIGLIYSFNDHEITITMTVNPFKTESSKKRQELEEQFSSDYVQSHMYTVPYTLKNNTLKMQYPDNKDKYSYSNLKKDKENIILIPIEEKNKDGNEEQAILEPYSEKKSAD